MQSLQCEICFEPYNTSSKAPKILPTCGHTICALCLTTILKNSDFKCPFDKRPFPFTSTTLASFVTNFALQGIIEEAPKQLSAYCQSHPSQKEEYFCVTDKKRVCSHCVLFGGHRNHNIRPVGDLKPILEGKERELQGLLEVLEFSADFDRVFEENWTSIKSKIDDHYRGMELMLNIQKSQLLLDLNGFITRENRHFEGLSDQANNLRDAILMKISHCKETATTENLLEILDEDTAYLASEVQKELDSSQEKVTKLKGAFGKVTELLDQFLDTQMAVVIQLEVAMKNFTEVLDSQSLCLKERELNLPAGNSILVTHDKDSIEIILGSPLANSEKVILPEHELNQLTTAKLNFGSIPSKKINIKTLKSIWPVSESITHVEVSVPPLVEIPAKDLLKIFSIVFSNAEKLLSVKLELEQGGVTDVMMSVISKTILAKAVSLQSLFIKVDSSNIMDSSLQVLSEHVLIMLKNLKNLSLDLRSSTKMSKVSEEGVVKVLSSISNLQSLVLNFEDINVSSTSLLTLANQIKGPLKSLKKLELKIPKASIGERAGMDFINVIKGKVPECVVNLSNVPVMGKANPNKNKTFYSRAPRELDRNIMSAKCQGRGIYSQGLQE